MDIYIVKQGDTVYSIARQFSVSPERLMINNGIKEGDTLVVGQSLLIIYPETVHTVKRGETIYSIAEEYNVSVTDILRNNYNLRGNTTIYEGQSLVIKNKGQKNGAIMLNSYAYPYITDEALYSQIAYQTYLSPFTYGFTGEGQLVPLADEKLISAAGVYGVMPLMHLSTLTPEGNFSNELASVILNDKEKQRILADQILSTIQEKGYFGLDIDFEFVYAGEDELYAQFVSYLRERLNTYGYKVIVALAPKTSDEQRGLIYEGHNYALLGEAANLAFVMTYEWGYTYGPPLAVSPLNSVRAVLDYAVSRIPPSKILMGLPNYAYDWKLPFVKGVTRADLIGNLDAVRIAAENNREILFDEYQQTPYFYYYKNGEEHVIWFDDARSMMLKTDLIREYSLAGAGVWNMMREFPQLWLILNEKYYII